MASVTPELFPHQTQSLPNTPRAKTIELKVKSIHYLFEDMEYYVPKIDEQKIIHQFHNLYLYKNLHVGDVKKIAINHLIINLAVKGIRKKSHPNIPKQKTIVKMYTNFTLNPGKFASKINSEISNKPFIQAICDVRMSDTSQGLTHIHKPIFINYKELENALRTHFDNQKIAPSITLKCNVAGHPLTVTVLKIVNLFSGHECTESNDEALVATPIQINSKLLFKLETPQTLHNEINSLTLGSDKIRDAALLSIHIKDIRSLDPEKRFHSLCFAEDEIRNAIIKISQGAVWRSSSWYIPVSNREGTPHVLEIEIHDMDDRSGNITPTTSVLTQLWKVNQSTTLSITFQDHLKLRLMNSSVPRPIKSMHIQFEIASKPVLETDEIIKEDLIHFLRTNAESFVTGDQLFYCDPRLRAIKLTIDDITLNVPPQTLQRLHGKIHEYTEFRFSPINSHAGYLTTMDRVRINNAKEFLSYYGLGGVDENLIDFFDMLKAQVKDNPEKYTSLGQFPPKGILFHGPDGVGKTLFVKALQEWLEVPPQHFDSFHASELAPFLKIPGDNLFQNNLKTAFFEHEMLGNRAPFRIIHVDDIESLFNQYQNPLSLFEDIPVSKFIDSFESEGQIWPRLLIVGTTKDIKALNKELLLPGRMEKQFALTLPNAQSRVEIFAIHTRKLRKKGLIHEEITNASLANASSYFTGADIKHVVKLAFEAADKRTRHNNRIPLCLNQEDFDQAIESIKKTKRDEHEKTGSYIS